MSGVGYIKLHRKILDNPIICKDGETFSIWIYLLLQATHEEIPALFKGQRITLKEGQLLTGIISISEKLHINRSKVQRTLKMFENEKQIEQQTSNQNRLVSIINWNKYQKDEKPFEKQVKNEWKTSEKQVKTNKNVKNVKNVRNIYKDFSDELKNALDSFVEMRIKIKKPLTDRAMQLAINKLNSLSTNEQIQIQIINNSVLNGWQTFYPLKEIKQTNFNNYKQRYYDNLDNLYANKGG